jgi:5-methylcytosine-specific restriction endonuclease McrA
VTEFDLDPRDCWRGVILYGLNTATYKIALGQCLARFACEGRDRVTMPELAEAFFDLYADRLQAGRPQLVLPGRLTVMERIVGLHSAGQLTRSQAVERVAAQAFNDVLPRFHTVGNTSVPVAFYEHSASGLVLTDEAFRVLTGAERDALLGELGSRWDLLEAAFEARRDVDQKLVNDVRQIYLERGYQRTDVTRTRPVLNGYQRGLCFYCGEPIGLDWHVDHLIPRQFVQHDEIWNLVLAHEFCNEQKSDALPSLHYLEKLVVRNEHFIASNHPIKERLIAALGPTPEQRRTATQRAYDDARVAIPYSWSALRGYDPEEDPLYRTFVRRLAR